MRIVDLWHKRTSRSTLFWAETQCSDYSTSSSTDTSHTDHMIYWGDCRQDVGWLAWPSYQLLVNDVAKPFWEPLRLGLQPTFYFKHEICFTDLNPMTKQPGAQHKEAFGIDQIAALVVPRSPYTVVLWGSVFPEEHSDFLTVQRKSQCTSRGMMEGCGNQQPLTIWNKPVGGGEECT